MRRRAADYRRPVRRRFSIWIWGLLGLFAVAGVLLFVTQHSYQDHDLVERPPLLDENSRKPHVHVHRKKLNSTIGVNLYARRLLEQMTLAKAYVVITKEHNNLHLAWELSLKIRSCQFLLSKAAMREAAVRRQEAEPLIRTLSALIFKAQEAHYDIATTIMTMKSHIHALEERAHSATVQSTFFGQLAAGALPKDHHCVNVRLLTDWLTKKTLRAVAAEKSRSPRLIDNNLHHFCLFSDNLLAVSAVVNSTVSNADHPGQLVFHVVTNRAGYGPMQAWFASHGFRGSIVEVQKVEDFTWLNASYSPIVRWLTEDGSSHGNPKSESLLNHLRFYVPEIYPHLEKVVFLDDDIVVQKDLTPLFSLDLHGNVNGAVETCLDSFHRLYKYVNFSNPVLSSRFDPQACGWAFGLNVFDLVAWREANVTETYQFWQEQNVDGTLWTVGTLPVGLLAFYGRTEPLDRRWHVLGLGYDVNVDDRLIATAAVVHFNGYLKPWLEFGFRRYKPLWDRYVDRTHSYLLDCATS